MSADGTYNGYANYQTWNVCLWISNDEGLNEFASVCVNYGDFKARLRQNAVGCLDSPIAYETPDGVAWNDSGVNLAEMQKFWQDNFSQATA